MISNLRTWLDLLPIDIPGTITISGKPTIKDLRAKKIDDTPKLLVRYSTVSIKKEDEREVNIIVSVTKYKNNINLSGMDTNSNTGFRLELQRSLSSILVSGRYGSKTLKSERVQSAMEVFNIIARMIL